MVRQQSAIAAYWHEYARQLPPPPTAEQRAAAQEAAEDSSRRERVAAAERFEQFRWGGRAPSNRLRLLGGNVLGVARTDRDLLDSFEALGEQAQRAAACWLARRAFELAELDRLDWVRPALDAMDRGDRLPAPFTSLDGAYARLRGGAIQSYIVVAASEGAPAPPRVIHRPSFALPALFSAIEPDPLQALVDAFSHAAATFDHDREILIAELCARFIT